MEPWVEHVKDFLNPVSSENTVGEDPRYSDNFSELKTEIEKKSGVDYERIRELAEEILKQQAKDLRVVSYLIMAHSRLDGFIGLAKGLTILCHLIDTFGEDLLPVKAKARSSAIRWFQQEKVLTFAQQATDNVSTEEANAALQAYNAAFERMSELSGEPMSWPELKKWLDSQKVDDPIVAPTSTPKMDDNISLVARSQPAPVSQVAGSDISSTAQYVQTLKSLLNYFKDQKDYSRLFAVACACQWGSLKLPPNENGKTRLPPARDASMHRIHNAMANEQWLDGLIACLDAFLEPSGQFQLDILKLAAECASKSGEKDVSALIQMNVRLLTERLPKLWHLKFENGDPFAGAAATSWIEQITQSDPESKSSGSVSGQELMTEARSILADSTAQEAFHWLDDQPVSNEIDRLQIQYCKAQLCVEQGRSDLALPLFLRLENDVEQLRLALVAPELAMQVWRQLYRLQVERLATLEQGSLRMETEQHISNLQTLMCTTDVASAIQWL